MCNDVPTITVQKAGWGRQLQGVGVIGLAAASPHLSNFELGICFFPAPLSFRSRKNSPSPLGRRYGWSDYEWESTSGVARYKGSERSGGTFRGRRCCDNIHQRRCIERHMHREKVFLPLALEMEGWKEDCVCSRCDVEDWDFPGSVPDSRALH